MLSAAAVAAFNEGAEVLGNGIGKGRVVGDLYRRHAGYGGCGGGRGGGEVGGSKAPMFAWRRVLNSSWVIRPRSRSAIRVLKREEMLVSAADRPGDIRGRSIRDPGRPAGAGVDRPSMA